MLRQGGTARRRRRSADAAEPGRRILPRPADATAFAHRDAEAMLVAAMLLPADPASGQVEETQARWAAVTIHGSGAHVNFAGSATEADLAAIYPPATRQRLAAVKRAHDPGNVFRRNHNICPGHS